MRIRRHILAEEVLEPVSMGVKLLDLLRKMYPGDFRLLEPSGKWKLSFISLLSGHREFKGAALESEEILCGYSGECHAFRFHKVPYAIYPKG